ncbi:uncharacterized protein C7orf57 homolog [Argopecten irradians]|uniref:uncharacterized protein C7orf57 homolog n=1 Tax=Argopecten irradians TaxID=31199 RepID=UPI003722F1E5
MATTTAKKIKEAGWFYHAPARRKNVEPVLVPPTSQIPGLNDPIEGEMAGDQVRPLYRDTDTKYIRLAKQGGRQNLLQFKENPKMSEKPCVGYPRSEWFYLEDNAIEDAATEPDTNKYEFRVPEYMAHDVHQPSTDDGSLKGRTPYAYDRLSAYDREGKSLKDKTLKLPEVKRSGYGVRIAKPPRVKSQHQERTKPSDVAKISQLERERPHLKYLPLPEEEKDKAKMSKLLSFAYDKEWQDRITKWQAQQDKVRDKHRALVAADTQMDKEPINTEYRTTIGKQLGSSYRRSEKGKKQGEQSYSTQSNPEQQPSDRSTKGMSKKEKELFKLSRFKNVPSKVDSYNAVKDVPVVTAH